MHFLFYLPYTGIYMAMKLDKCVPSVSHVGAGAKSKQRG